MTRFPVIAIIGFVVIALSGLLVAQEDSTEPAPVEDARPVLELTIAQKTCALALVGEDLDDPDAMTETTLVETTPEATPESTPVQSEDLGILPTAQPTPVPTVHPIDPITADYPVMTLGDDCNIVIPYLDMLTTETRWMAVSSPDETAWLTLRSLNDDPYPPHLDGRGRYFGCVIPVEGEQTCRVLVEWNDAMVLVEIPVVVEPPKEEDVVVVSAPPAAPQPTAVIAQPAPTAVPPAVAAWPSLPLPNIDPAYSGGTAIGERINWYQGDHAVHLYPLLDGNGNRFLQVYRIVGAEGRLIMTISPADIAPFLNNLPTEALLLKYENGPGRYGPAYLYLLPNGTLQFNIGPDDEDRVQALFFSGPAATGISFYTVYVP
jgi:hypothetical protein